MEVGFNNMVQTGRWTGTRRKELTETRDQHGGWDIRRVAPALPSNSNPGPKNNLNMDPFI
eukprot:766283-Hanusia_phi.AAC.3